MRSQLVFDAVRHVPNRYLLMRAAAKALRKFHKPNTRVADTANKAFRRFGRTQPLSVHSSNRGEHVTHFHRAA
jgi:hypothetical protein